ncbi:MAG: HEAT repeat domain-containing protein [Thermosynechococcaceae cyanobacterium]
MIANSHDNNVTLNISEFADSLAWDGGCQDYSFHRSPAIREVIIPALVDNLKDKKSPDRAETASIIGRISPAATSAVPALISAMSDRDEGVRRSAVDALQRIDVIALRQALIANLQHKNKEIRKTAIEEMKLLTKDAALIAALQDKDKKLRQQAIDDFLKRSLPIPEPKGTMCASPVPAFTNAIRRFFRR